MYCMNGINCGHFMLLNVHVLNLNFFLLQESVVRCVNSGAHEAITVCTQKKQWIKMAAMLLRHWCKNGVW